MIELFLPKTRRGILGLLVLHPGESFYLREIVRAVRGSPGTVQRELRALTKAGILTREKRGIQTYYRLREDCPILPEIRGMLLKTTGLVEVLRTALRGLQ
ncbi:MAG: winged helix-turn-helix domain-containing protein, partial [Armatimonadota bacterium]